MSRYLAPWKGGGGRDRSLSAGAINWGSRSGADEKGLHEPRVRYRA